jgi:hypothetical protein
VRRSHVGSAYRAKALRIGQTEVKQYNVHWMVRDMRLGLVHGRNMGYAGRV